MAMNHGYDRKYLVSLICTKCEFYKEDEEDLECGAFKILKNLLQEGLVTPQEILNARR